MDDGRRRAMSIRFSDEENDALERMKGETQLSKAWLVRYAVRLMTGLEQPAALRIVTSSSTETSPPAPPPSPEDRSSP